jgi:23S rRNA pseudouridine1911/1915/1917 synthase
MPPTRPAPLQVIHEDNHLLALVKPAGLATMGVAEGTPSLLAAARQYIKLKHDKPGNVYLGAMSRLDVPVSGVVLFARTSKAAARLTEQFRERTVEKTYWALVEGRIEAAAGEYVDWLAEDERHRKMHIVGPNFAGAREARLSWRRIASDGKTSRVEVRLETGRKHQIRLQFAHHGHPVLGDRKYGARATFPAGIALHARRLVVQHPTLGTPLELVAPLPAAWGKST